MLLVFTCACALVAPRHPQPAARVVAPRSRVVASTPSSFERAQWELLLRHHEGFWKGVWTSVDQRGEQVDEVEADSAWVQTKGGDLIQVNTYFIGSVRSSCEVCQDSVQARQLQVGSYSEGQMAGVRLAGRGIAFGPRVTKRGAMTAELGLRDGVSRLRVLFAYEPQYAPTGGPPTALSLGRVSVIRESFDRPPLREEPRAQSDARPSGRAADFWRPSEGAPLLGLWQGERALYAPSDGANELRTEPVAPTHLRKCKCSAPAPADADAAEAEANVVLHLPGGISVECPRDILPATPTELRIGWQPEGAEPGLLRAALALTALGRVVSENEEEVVITPPTCDGFVVEQLEQLAPALG
jgi:hypothetical protein